MDARELFTRCLDRATRTFRQLTPDDYKKPTPDTEWNAKVLAGHMLYELSWIPDLLAGKTIAAVGNKYDGDLLGDTPVENWEEAAALAKGEVKLADLQGKAHVSYGKVSNEDYLRQVSGDLLIHSWDLAAALGLDRALDPEAVRAVYEGMLPVAPSLSESGLFKPSLSVSPDADVQTKLLALTGRDASWQPTA